MLAVRTAAPLQQEPAPLTQPFVPASRVVRHPFRCSHRAITAALGEVIAFYNNRLPVIIWGHMAEQLGKCADCINSFHASLVRPACSHRRLLALTGTRFCWPHFHTQNHAETSQAAAAKQRWLALQKEYQQVLTEAWSAPLLHNFRCLNAKRVADALRHEASPQGEDTTAPNTAMEASERRCPLMMGASPLCRRG